LSENDASIDIPPPYFQDLNALIGLAFTAILAQDSNVKDCRSSLNYFLDNRHTISINIEDHLLIAITQILEKGFSAFKFLGFPYYFDDFLQAYHHFLNSSSTYLPRLNQKMKEILEKNIFIF
jgi:hypothetical protein